MVKISSLGKFQKFISLNQILTKIKDVKSMTVRLIISNQSAINKMFTTLFRAEKISSLHFPFIATPAWFEVPGGVNKGSVIFIY